MVYNNKQNILFIIDFFTKKGYPTNFICGLLGNICSETGGSFNPNQVQFSYLNNSAYKIASCDDYVARVDNGTWLDPNGKWFGEDRVGIGLTQLTSSGRKTKYYEYCKGKGTSVGDLVSQLEWIDIEIHSVGYANVRKAISENWSIEECARVICTDFERPKNKLEESTQNTRIQYALEIYKQFFSQKGETNVKNKILAINAGHWNGNPKGVPKSMPFLRGTREFALNNNVVNEVVKMLANYNGVTVIQNYDVTGKDGNQATNGLDYRIAWAEREKADMYISIHHNGGGGRGTVVFCYKNSNNIAQAKRLYNKIIEQTNTKGNRATPVNHNSDLIEIWKPSMTSFLIECAFMDNAEDVKLIAQADWSKKVATGITNFLVEEWELTPKNETVIHKEEPVEQKKPVETSSLMSYTIKKGDTLGSIAIKYGTTAVQIAKVNPSIVNLNKIYVGQVIIIPVDNKIRTYTVQSGETLSKIGKKLGVNWKEIAKANNIPAPFYVIRKGQTLVIPTV